MKWVFEREDGGLSFGETRLPIDEFIKKLPFKVVNYWQEDVDTNCEFRDAWCAKDKKQSINMEKARNIQMDKIRALRNKKLKELDIETMKGKDVQAEKQKLRDIPQTFDLSVATTPEELKTLWPDELK